MLKRANSTFLCFVALLSAACRSASQTEVTEGEALRKVLSRIECETQELNDLEVRLATHMHTKLAAMEQELIAAKAQRAHEEAMTAKERTEARASAVQAAQAKKEPSEYESGQAKNKTGLTSVSGDLVENESQGGDKGTKNDYIGKVDTRRLNADVLEDWNHQIVKLIKSRKGIRDQITTAPIQLTSAFPLAIRRHVLSDFDEGLNTLREWQLELEKLVVALKIDDYTLKLQELDSARRVFQTNDYIVSELRNSIQLLTQQLRLDPVPEGLCPPLPPPVGDNPNSGPASSRESTATPKK